MSRLQRVDSQSVLESLAHVCSYSEFSTLGPDALFPLMRSFRSSSLLLLSQQDRKKPDARELKVAINQPRRSLERYYLRYRKKDPVLLHSAEEKGSPRCSAFRYSDLEVEIDPEFSDFLAGTNVKHMLVLGIPLNYQLDKRLLLAIHRDQSLSDFTGEDCLLGEQVGTILRQSFQGMLLKEHDREIQNITRSFIGDVSRQPHVLVDESGHPIDATTSAKNHPLFSSVESPDPATLEQLARFFASTSDVGSIEIPSNDSLVSAQVRRIRSARQLALLTLPVRPTREPPNWALLTPRQLQVTGLLASGAMNCQIAAELGVSENTVVNHLGAVYEKLKIRGRTELAVQWNNNPPNGAG
ncbi:MAG: LuxR C-terminal-related transcriptional regulator [Pseudomonadota bacterium]